MVQIQRITDVAWWLCQYCCRLAQTSNNQCVCFFSAEILVATLTWSTSCPSTKKAPVYMTVSKTAFYYGKLSFWPQNTPNLHGSLILWWLTEAVKIWYSLGNVTEYFTGRSGCLCTEAGQSVELSRYACVRLWWPCCLAGRKSLAQMMRRWRTFAAWPYSRATPTVIMSVW